jgi:hypothetical protein
MHEAKLRYALQGEALRIRYRCSGSFPENFDGL